MHKQLLHFIAVFCLALSSLTFAVQPAGVGHGKGFNNNGNHGVFNNPAPGNTPPGLNKQGKYPYGLSKKGKIPAGWNKGQKKGWKNNKINPVVPVPVAPIPMR